MTNEVNQYKPISTVKLVDLSCPVEYSETDGIQWQPESPRKLICDRARVSVPTEVAKSKGTELLNYLVKHKHWSPFEMATAGFLIETPRDVSRQLLRHRSFSFQEFSQRYSDPLKDISPDIFLRQVRLQDLKNRQNSLEDLGDLGSFETENEMYHVAVGSREVYKDMVRRGVAKEVARVVLPEGLTMSRLYMSGSIRSWIHFCDVRCDTTTQREHREVAEKVRAVIFDIMGLEEAK